MATEKYCFLDLDKGEWEFGVPEDYNVTEKPCEVIETKLPDILESDADPKYYLSAKACEGILRRAEQRGKKLPDVLSKALKNQIAISQNQREEIRDVGDKATSLNGSPGTHQQTFIAYKKSAHPRNKEEGQGYEETEVNDTLNTFDTGEARTPTVIAEKNGVGGDVSATITSSYGTKWNGNNGAFSGENFVGTIEPGIAAREGGHYYDGVSGTLRADMGDNQMAVVRDEVYGADQYNGDIIEEQSSSLGTNCGASTGRQSVVYGVCAKGNGDSFVTEESNGTVLCGGGMPGQGYPCVAGFCTEHSAQSRNIGYEEEKSPTLRATATPAVMSAEVEILNPWDSQSNQVADGEGIYPTIRGCGGGGYQQGYVCAVENHPQDSRLGIAEDGIIQTLSARMGMGGGNTPMVIVSANSMTTGSYMSFEEDIVNPLMARDYKDLQVVCYGVCSKDSNAMKSDNPESGFYEADTSRTIDGNGGNPSCNQGGIAVVEGNGSRPSHKGDGYNESETMYTLNATEQHAVAFSDKSATLSANDGPKGPSSQQMKNPEENFVVGKVNFGGYRESESSETLKANGGDLGGGSETLIGEMVKANNEIADHQQDLIQSAEGTSRCLAAGTHDSAPHLTKTVVGEENYYIRRLTPRECLKLMGLPESWCDGLGEDDPSEEELAAWAEIFETHRLVISHNKKPKTENQIRKWLKSPGTDGAIYKMAGNGLVVQCAEFVLGGIPSVTGKESVR